MISQFSLRSSLIVSVCTRLSHTNTIGALLNASCSRSIHQCTYSVGHSLLYYQRQKDSTQLRPCDVLISSERCKTDTNLLKSQLRGAQKKTIRKVLEELPELNESELDENNVLGSGPGGQAVNKSHNACFLRHRPTGIVVKSHKTRSFEMNRQYARLELRHKLDAHYNRDNSVRARALRESMQRKSDKKRKTNERLEKLRAFKEREGLT